MRPVGNRADQSLLDRPVELATTIRRWYALAETAALEEVAKLAGTQPPAPARPPATTQPQPARPTRPAATATPPTEEFDVDDEPENVQAEDDSGPDPTTGSQLLGWARKQDPDMKGYIFGAGKKLKYPTRVIDWTERQVANVYAAAHKAQQRK